MHQSGTRKWYICTKTCAVALVSDTCAVSGYGHTLGISFVSLLVSCELYHACHSVMPSVQTEGVCTDSVHKNSIGAISCKTVDHKQRGSGDMSTVKLVSLIWGGHEVINHQQAGVPGL